MKRELMNILACPVCKGNLEFGVTEESGQEIISGRLRCPRCQMLYPIEEGIPNLLLQRGGKGIAAIRDTISSSKTLIGISRPP